MPSRSTKMNIIFFFENYSVGGGSKYASDCISICTSLGHKVLLLANKDAFSTAEFASFSSAVKIQEIYVFERTQLIQRLLGDGIIPTIARKVMIVFDPLFLCLNIANISRFLLLYKPDLLISCNGGYPASEASLAALIAADILKIMSTLVVMSEPRSRRALLGLYDRLLDYFVLCSDRQIVVNSSKQRTSLETRRGAQQKNIHVVYNGISDFDSSCLGATKLKQNEFIIGVVCRLDKQKGIGDLIKAFAAIHEYSSLRLKIIGEGSFRMALMDLCGQLNISEKVSFVGFKYGTDLENAYKSIDLYVLPSHWEGLPYGIIEAMRASLPIIATDVGGVSEAIRHEVEGLLVPPQSPDLLKEAILRIYANPDEANRFSKAARSRYLKLFTKEAMMEAFSAII